MPEIDRILSDINHRSFDYPNGKWQFYQEWNKALFLHWKVPFKELRKHVPNKLKIDTIDGFAYI